MSVSTLSFATSQYKMLQKLQKQYADSVTEATTNRHADVGLTLGRLTGTSVSYRVRETSLDARLQSNKVVDNRLDLIYDAMGSISTAATDLQGSVLTAKKYAQYQSLAKSALEQMQGVLNTSDGGTYIFAGTNVDNAPVPTVETGLTAAKAKYDAFLAAVGATADPAKVTADQMKAFLGDTGYVAVDYPTAGTNTTFRFQDTVASPAWEANWSKATNDLTSASISNGTSVRDSETVETSASANGDGFRKLTATYSMLAVIDINSLGDAAKDAVTSAAATTLAAGSSALTAQRAAIGTRQTRVDAANTALTSQKDIVEKAFNDMEGVDAYEASQKMNAYELQLNTAMAATARLQKMSILDYL